MLFLCFAYNYISVIVQEENVLNADLHLFQIRNIEKTCKLELFVTKYDELLIFL